MSTLSPAPPRMPRPPVGLRLRQHVRARAAELSAFGVVGGVSYVVDVAGGNALAFGLGLGPLTSKACATVAATLVAYAGNRYWTFRHRDLGDARRRYPVFFLLNAVGLGIAMLCLAVTRYGLGLDGPLAYNLSANVVGTGLGTVFRYWSYRRWVFTERRPGTVVTRGTPRPADRARS
ncbi:GtrA family protein [Streptomyces sp. URMC 129]|uniref:GtrA family protein n=1 Tax=Streptomyces sp. URMC 129 TaxID=3423407 RepID=UPI003F1D241C